MFLGQEEEYRHNRKALLARFGKTTSPQLAERTGPSLFAAARDGRGVGSSYRSCRARGAIERSKAGILYPHFQFVKGLADYRQGRFDRAIVTMRGDAAPVLGPAPEFVLAMALQKSGNEAEARKTLAAAVLSYDWRPIKVHNQDDWICHVLRREAESLILPELAAFLEGKHRPRDNDERLALLGVCQFSNRNLAAARLYADAFAADPSLAVKNVGVGHRATAARFAAQAGCGHGEDVSKLGEEERSRWRAQARRWLRADLEVFNNYRPANPTEFREGLHGTLTSWLKEPYLDGLREPTELEKLPAEERADCIALWNEVRVVLERKGTIK